MGKANQGVFGSFRGKVGNVVGRILQGQQVYAIYQPSVANPDTLPQRNQRARFAALTAVLKDVVPALKVGFANLDGYDKGNPFSAALGYNLKKSGVVTAVDGVATVSFANLEVSQGAILNGYNMGISLTSTDADLTWTDNSGLGNAEATDQLCVLAYCYDLKQYVFAEDLAMRNARTATIALPTTWTGNRVHIYAFMRRGTLASPNYYSTFEV